MNFLTVWPPYYGNTGCGVFKRGIQNFLRQKVSESFSIFFSLNNTYSGAHFLMKSIFKITSFTKVMSYFDSSPISFGYEVYPSTSGLLSFNKPETVLWTIANNYYYYYYYYVDSNAKNFLILYLPLENITTLITILHIKPKTSQLHMSIPAYDSLPESQCHRNFDLPHTLQPIIERVWD